MWIKVDENVNMIENELTNLNCATFYRTYALFVERSIRLIRNFTKVLRGLTLIVIFEWETQLVAAAGSGFDVETPLNEWNTNSAVSTGRTAQ